MEPYNMFAVGGVVKDVAKTSPVVRNVVQRQVPVVDSNSSTAGMDYLNSLYTSPADEERMRRSSVANQRILAVGDALRQIGNIYHTVKGAPSQTFNNPVQEEYGRYQQAKAVRDAANQRYYSYQQAKAAQDAQAARWSADYQLKVEDAMRKAGYTAAQIQNMKDRLAQQTSYQNGQLAARNRQIDSIIAHQKETERQGRQRIGIAAQNSNRAEAHRQWIRNNKGSGKGGGTLTFRGKNGFYSKNMSANDVNAFYNQAFETLANTRLPNGKTVIDKKAVSGEVIPGLFGGNKINMQARKQAVDNAIANYPEAGDLLRNQYEFSFDPRGAQQPSQNVQRQPNVFFSPWNLNQQASSGYNSTFKPFVDDDDDEDMFDDEDFSGISF